MSIIIFFLMNLVVMMSSFLLTFRIFRLSNFIDSLVSWFILYLAQIVLSELVLGILGALFLKNLILLNLLILIVIIFFTRNRAHYFKDLTQEGLFCYANLPELSGVASQNYSAKPYHISHIEGRRRISLGISNSKIASFAASVIVAFGLVKIAINLFNPPFGWDSLNYHFTFAVEWLKQGNLDIPIVISDDPSPSYYPINGSLFYLWLMLPLKNVFLADLGQVPFFILSFLSVYSIARKIDLGKDLSFFAGALFILIPNFFKQLQISYLDVMVAGLFLAGVNYLFLLSKSFSLKNIIIFSLTLGLLLGSKTITLPYCLLLLIPFVYYWSKNTKKPELLIFLMLPILVLGSFSYLRNFLRTQNPLYPLELKLFGKTILRGVMDINVYRAHSKPGDYLLSKILFHEGLGIQSILFILPSIFLALPVALIKRKKEANFNLLYFFILPILIYLVYRYIIPLANVRYLFPLLGLGIILGFYLIKALNINKVLLNSLIIISSIASSLELAKRQELAVSIILTLALFFLTPFLLRLVKLKSITCKPLSLTLFSILLITGLILSERWYLKNEFSGYIKMAKYSGFWPDAVKAWDWLNRNTTGNNIAYVGRPVPFPLYGNNFKNNVYYVSINKTDPVKLHYFLNSHYQWDDDFLNLHKNLETEGNYRAGADYSLWLNNLKRRNTGYLFIYSLHQTKTIEFPLEDRWARDNPVKFRPVFLNQTIHIYELIK